MRNILIDNDGVVYLEELKDETGAVVIDAIVHLYVLDNTTENEITGVNWPFEMEHVGGGTYKAPLSRDIDVEEGQYVILKIIASHGGKKLTVEKRYRVAKNRL